MCCACWSLLLLFGVSAARGELEIQNVQASYGPLGPPRKLLEYHPDDLVVFRYLVTGAHVDADGKLDATQTIALTDPRGRRVLERTSTIQAVPALGGGTFASFAQVALPDDPLVGPYTLAVSVRDNVAATTASFQRRLAVRRAAFAIVAPEFFLDPDYAVPGPAAGVVGQTLYFRLRVIGLDRSQGKIDAHLAFQAVGPKRREPLARPTQVAFRTDDEALVRKMPYARFAGHLVLNRPGDFALLLTITDRIARKTTRLEVPLHVAEP